MTLFRPCIDLHGGQVKQIVGRSLQDDAGRLQTNFVSRDPAAHFAKLYQSDKLTGGHVIQLGTGNEQAALEALQAWPEGLQLGGGVTAANAQGWLERGASKVIVTSFLFENGELSEERLKQLEQAVPRERLVIDLSCRKRGDAWFVAANRWQTVTSTEVGPTVLDQLARYCSEFLVHAADVEGLCQGIDGALVELLGKYSPLPCTYAGGANALSDLDRVSALSGGRVDLTFGSALDIFGGKLVRYADCVLFNKARAQVV